MCLKVNETAVKNHVAFRTVELVISHAIKFYEVTVTYVPCCTF